MNYKIIIDPYRGGSDTGNTSNNLIEKDYNLKLGEIIYNDLISNNIPVSITRNNDSTINDDERISKINAFYPVGPNVIVLSFRINSESDGGMEVNYALRNNDTLANDISQSLEKSGFPVNKYYQKRSEEDTSEDSDIIIRETEPNQTLIMYYGDINNTKDRENIINNLNQIAKAITNGIKEYIGVIGNFYYVKKGDTLYSVASLYNTTVDNLKKLNNLATNTLLVGQQLKVPLTEELPSNNYYIVKKGDTLYSIASNNNISVNELKSLNNLTSNTLSIGQKLLLNNNNNISSNTYKVISGDSLYKIAKQFDTTVETLKSLNNLTTNTLSIGQILNLPSSSFENYTVKKGDNLYSIAASFNTTVEKIKNLNNLTSNLLSIGQILKIPS